MSSVGFVNKETIKAIAEKNFLTFEDVERILNTVYSEEELKKMSLVSQLRLIGRVKGVKSPTSKKMNDLVECIIAIQEGKVKPTYSSFGRGVKPSAAHVVLEKPEETKPETQTGYYSSTLNQCPPDQAPQTVIYTPNYNTDVDNTQTEKSQNSQNDNTADISDTKEMGSNDGQLVDDTQTSPPDSEDNTAQFDKSSDSMFTGMLDLMPEGYGFLRTFNYYASKNDVYVGAQQIKRFNLRAGDKIVCTARVFDKTKSPSLIFIHTVNDDPCDKLGRRPYFSDFEAAYPKERIRLEPGAEKFDFSLRAIDLVAPIGMGQRGLIAAPPKTGKTTLLKKIAQSVTKTYGDSLKVFVLLIDERPEEVTDFKESVPDAEVVFSTFDQAPEHHTSVAEMLLNNCKHRVEQGQDVLLLLDSITRLARAYNKTAEATGRTLTGGLDIAALETPKAFFGSARRVMTRGSLTILATALVETGSRMDDIIYEEFKGTGNMEIHLNRAMSDRRIFPAIDLIKSSTRHEEKLLTQNELEGMWLIRRKLAKTDNVEASVQLLDLLTCTVSNEEFIKALKVIK